MRSWRYAALLALLLVSACGSAPPPPSPTGWAGSGASFAYDPADGVAWSFVVDGRDLNLTRDGARMVLANAVGKDGVRYGLESLTVPEIWFDLEGGRRARWTGATVDVAGSTYTFGPQTVRIDLGDG